MNPARLGMAVQGMEGHGVACRCSARQGMARRGLFSAASGSHRCPVQIALRGQACRGKARRGLVWKGKAWAVFSGMGFGSYRCKSHQMVCPGEVGQGPARLGGVWYGMEFYQRSALQCVLTIIERKA